MEKSLYYQYVEKYFPQLVIAISEKLNDKNQTALGYLYKSLLKTDYYPLLDNQIEMYLTSGKSVYPDRDSALYIFLALSRWGLAALPLVSYLSL